MAERGMQSRPGFSAGHNMAMKVPPECYDETLRFYRDVLGLRALAHDGGEAGFEFSGKRLWIDNVPGIKHAELWLELRCDDLEAAGRCLEESGIERCDEVEVLPENFAGFWIRNPAGLVHLVCTGD